MSGLDGLGIGALMQDYPWSELCDTIVDIGGGRGSFLSSLLRVAPRAQGVLFELPSVITDATAADYLSPFSNRVTYKPGSLFESGSIPSFSAGRVCYVTKQVLLDWNDESVTTIANHVANAMKQGDLFIIVEPFIRTPETDPARVMVDIQMFSFGGFLRTGDEYASIFEQFNLFHHSSRPTRSMLGIHQFVKL